LRWERGDMAGETMFELVSCLVVYVVIADHWINPGMGGAPAPGPLSTGPHNIFTIIIFMHMKYTKNEDIPKMKMLQFTHKKIKLKKIV